MNEDIIRTLRGFRVGDIAYDELTSIDFRISVIELDGNIGRINGYDHKNYKIITAEELVSIKQGRLKLLIDSNSEYIKILREIHPETSVTQIKGGKLVMYVLFKETEVTNTERAKHTVKDIVFKLTLNADGTLARVEARRFTLTKDELNSGYCHSHIKYYGNMEFTMDVCFGATELAERRAGLQESKNVLGFELFLLQLEDYLSWESLAGGPHSKISSISHSYNMPVTIGLTAISSVMDGLRINNQFEILVNEDGLHSVKEDSITSSILKLGNTLNKEYIGKYVNEVFYSNTTSDGRRNTSEEQRFLNSGVLDIEDDFSRLTLTPTLSNVISDLGLEIHKELIEAISRIVNKELNDFTLNKELNAIN